MRTEPSQQLRQMGKRPNRYPNRKINSTVKEMGNGSKEDGRGLQGCSARRQGPEGWPPAGFLAFVPLICSLENEGSSACGQDRWLALKYICPSTNEPVFNMVVDRLIEIDN